MLESMKSKKQSTPVCSLTNYLQTTNQLLSSRLMYIQCKQILLTADTLSDLWQGCSVSSVSPLDIMQSCPKPQRCCMPNRILTGHKHRHIYLCLTAGFHLFCNTYWHKHHSKTLTHWGRDQIDAISQTTFSNAFSRMKMNQFRLGFHWILFLRFELMIFQHWFR